MGELTPVMMLNNRTDSQYVVDIIAKITDVPGYRPSYKDDNHELIQLCNNWNPRLHVIIKVKAHLTLEDATLAQSRWDILANHVADRLAALALSSDSSDTIQLAEALRTIISRSNQIC